jgi:hypothetical protein
MPEHMQNEPYAIALGDTVVDTAILDTLRKL